MFYNMREKIKEEKNSQIHDIYDALYMFVLQYSLLLWKKKPGQYSNIRKL